MSQHNTWVVRTLTIIMFATMFALTGGISTASAVPGDPIIPTTPSCVVTLTTGDPATAPPAPTCYDPSGSDLDEFLVPMYVDGSGRTVSYVDASMNTYWKDRPNSTKGASQVPVQSMYYDPVAGGYVNGHAWTLTFNTSVTAAPGPNSYWVTAGPCIGMQGIREVTAFFKNEVGPDGRYVGYVFPQAKADGAGALDTQPAYRVYDGSSVAIPLVYTSYKGAGLLAGYTYTVSYWLEDRSSLPDSGAGTRRLGGSVTVNVPECSSGSTPPPPPSSSTVEPRAKIVIVKRGVVFNTVKVVLGSRKATAITRYKIINNPRSGPTLRKVYNTKYKVVKYTKIRKGTMIKVNFKKLTVQRRI